MPWKKQSGVEVILFTENGHGKKGFLTSVVVNDFINQYPTLRIKPNPDCHDRWIILIMAYLQNPYIIVVLPVKMWVKSYVQ